MFRKILVLTVLTALAVTARADLWQDLAAYHYGDPSNAPDQLDQLVDKTPPDQYRPIEAKLIVVLQSDQATPVGKAFACRMLQRIGTERSIPALAKLLHDKMLSHYARLPLERMKAADVMRQALDGAPDSVVAGLMGSLGECRDEKAVRPIAQRITHPDPQIAIVAMRALGKIGNPSALQALEQANVPAKLRSFRDESIVACATKLGPAGYTALNRVYTGPTNDVQRIAALKEMVCIDGAKAAPLMIHQIKAKPSLLRRGTLRLIVTAPGKALTAALVEALDGFDPAAQAQVITLLGKRGDRSALGALKRYLNSTRPAIRKAAIVAVSELGGADEIRPLLELAASKPDVSSTVYQAMSRMGAAGIDQQLIGLLSESSLKVPAITVLAQRGCRIAGPAVVKLADDSDPQVRQAAWRNMAALATEQDIAALMKRTMAIRDKSERATARSAIKFICSEAEDRAACFQAISAHYAQADADTQLFVLSLGPSIGTPEALALERSALASSNVDLKKAALRAMAAWPNDAAAADLLQAARQSSTGTEKIVALRGFIEVAGKGGSSRQQIARYAEAGELASRPDEKRLLIGKLQNCRDAGAFEILKTYLADPQVKNEAATAIIGSAPRLVNRKNRAEVLATLQQIASTPGNKNLARRAKDAVKRIESGRR